MARLYSDENFPYPVVEHLRQLGHDVLTIHQDGKANQQFPDESVLAAAISYNRAVLTVNRKHFRRLHQVFPSHSGIILCTYDPDYVGQAHRIHEALSEAIVMEGVLFRVNRPAQNT